MDRRKAAGVCLVVIGGVGLGALYSRGSLRHPVDAVAETGPIEYGGIGLVVLCLTVGIVLVLGSFVDAT